jgi:hypothetical protein
MLTYFKYVEFGEYFAYPVKDKKGTMWIKTNHGRGRLDPIRTSLNPKPVFRRFKNLDIVLTGAEITLENQYMLAPEPPCCNNPHVIPFDNDQQCTNCGYIGREVICKGEVWTLVRSKPWEQFNPKTCIQ